MDLIADILLGAGALAATFYCAVLGRRLKKFNSLEKGVGGAVAVLSSQVDDLKKTLEIAQSTATKSADGLVILSERAENIAKTLELQMASLHDIAEPGLTPETTGAETGSSIEADEAIESEVHDTPIFVRRAVGEPI